MNILLPKNFQTQAYGEQSDGSIIDLWGNVISSNEAINILDTVENLPITLEKQRIKDVIGNNIITILQGETGSGKSTQLPKFLSEDGYRVITTAPKVMAAMGLANRVSKELLVETGDPKYSLGYEVGYRTGEAVSSKHTSPISFHTDGTELMRWNMSGSSSDVIILDEVHNFAIPTEILAMKIRNEMLKTKKDIRLVIMSATLDPQIFQDYFKDIKNDIPFLSIPGRTFPVEHYYNNGQNAEKTILAQAKKRNNILVFCEGKKHIASTIDLLQKQVGEVGHEVEILPLHSELSYQEQQKAIEEPRLGTTKIIVATNIAEESITIPYINTVIDFGKEKTMTHNKLGISELRSENIAQANSKQRAGRAGRTQIGEYIRENETSYDQLKKYPDAPIQRQKLEREILLNIHGGVNILEQYHSHKESDRNLFMHDISERLLDLAYDNLAEMGLIFGNGQITALGKEVLKYPMSVENAVAFIESMRRKCSYDMLLISSILENGGFLQKGAWKKLKLDSLDQGDVFAYVEIFRKITQTQIDDNFAHELIQLGCKPNEIKKFIENNQDEQKLYEAVNLESLGIQEKKIDKIYRHIKNIKSRLKDSGISLENSGNQDDIKISLLSGYRGYNFDYQPSQVEKKYCLVSKKYKQFEFKFSNISTLNPIKGNQYFGLPFIIGGEEGKPDINIVSHLFEINSNLLSQVQEFDTVWENKHIQKSLQSQKKPFTQETAMNIYVEQIDDFTQNIAVNKFKDNHDAQENFVRNIAPNLMIAYNPYVKKWIAKQGASFDLSKFRQLLKKVLLEEKSRVNTNNLEKTKRSFIDDTSILDHFLESNDPHIEVFLNKRKSIPYIQLEDSDFPTISSDNKQEDFKLEELKGKYQNLVDTIPQKIDIQKVKSTLLSQYVDNQNYDEIFKHILRVSALQPDKIKDIIVQMNTITKSKIKLEKTVKNLRTAEAVKNHLYNVLLGNNTLDKLADYNISSAELRFINDGLFISQKEAIKKELNPFEKHLKSGISMQDIQSLLGKIEKFEKDLQTDEQILTVSIKAQNIAYAKDVYNAFVAFFQKIYSPKEFIAFSVNDKILSLTRKIFAHHDDLKFHYKLDIYNFIRKHVTADIENDIQGYRELNKLDDLYYTFDVYSNEIAKDVEISNHQTIVEHRIDELQQKLDEYIKLQENITI